MKKSLVAALSTALVVGAASTTFAAANPFSDVPADHWAYEAVGQLVADGVIDGYGDASFRGQQAITRYEMAQMIAKAMAKGANSAAVDKLAAEFAEELNSLGVRVAALEKKVDNVRWFGHVRYTARRHTVKKNGVKEHRGTALTQNFLQLRLYADAQVNKHWTAKAAFFYDASDNGKTGANSTLDYMDYLYMKGVYGNTTIDLGAYEDFEPVTEGMVWNHNFKGIKVTTGKDLKVSVQAGRANHNDYFGYDDENTPSTFTKDEAKAKGVDMWGVNVVYNKNNLKLGAGYYDFSNVTMLDAAKAIPGSPNGKARVWAVGAGYKFAKDFRLYATYAQNTEKWTGEASKNYKAYNIQLNYKGANIAKPGSWGLSLAYKHLGDMVVTGKCDYDWVCADMKGVEVGAGVTLDKNILLRLGYFKGKAVSDSSEKHQVLFSRIHFFF